MQNNLTNQEERKELKRLITDVFISFASGTLITNFIWVLV